VSHASTSQKKSSKRFVTRRLVGGNRTAVRTRVPRILFAGGGTGGHLLPGIATADVIRARFPGALLHFVGTGRSLEKKLVPEAGYGLSVVAAAPPRLGPVGFGRFAWRLLRGYAESRRLLERFTPDVLVGLGGYGAVAPALAAHRMGIPVALMEQNAVPGLAVRALARFARAVFCHFPETRDFLPRDKVVVFGSPLRHEICASDRVAPFPEGDGPALCILGGSLGARAINDAVTAAMPQLAARHADLRILHLAGTPDAAQTLREAYAAHRLRATVLPFFPHMGAVYRDADLVVARAGGMTVAELAAVGVPAILVPLPTARQDHQRRNAEALVRRGAAELASQDRLGQELAPRLDALLSHPQKLEDMRTASFAAGRPEAAMDVAETLLDWCEGGE
jgi:UDP-N-acetylglucosamine--N-acetylmuramyl-(pentapeptide) pyrophosphoryl-undecaprenol N-acetylglucosamine transferase